MCEPGLSDRDLWMCAVLIENRHGAERGAALVEERIAILIEQGDHQAAAVWEAILNRYDQLQVRHRGPLPA